MSSYDMFRGRGGRSGGPGRQQPDEHHIPGSYPESTQGRAELPADPPSYDLIPQFPRSAYDNIQGSRRFAVSGSSGRPAQATSGTSRYRPPTPPTPRNRARYSASPPLGIPPDVQPPIAGLPVDPPPYQFEPPLGVPRTDGYSHMTEPPAYSPLSTPDPVYTPRTTPDRDDSPRSVPKPTPAASSRPAPRATPRPANSSSNQRQDLPFRPPPQRRPASPHSPAGQPQSLDGWAAEEEEDYSNEGRDHGRQIPGARAYGGNDQGPPGPPGGGPPGGPPPRDFGGPPSAPGNGPFTYYKGRFFGPRPHGPPADYPAGPVLGPRRANGIYLNNSPPARRHPRENRYEPPPAPYRSTYGRHIGPYSHVSPHCPPDGPLGADEFTHPRQPYDGPVDWDAQASDIFRDAMRPPRRPRQKKPFFMF